MVDLTWVIECSETFCHSETHTTDSFNAIVASNPNIQTIVVQYDSCLFFPQSTALEVQVEDAKQKAARVNNALEQNLEMQKLLRDELVKKSEEISFNNTTIEGQERQIAYLKAEIAAMKTKLTQQDQAEEASLERVEDLQNQVEQLQELNNQLQLQVWHTVLNIILMSREGDLPN